MAPGEQFKKEDMNLILEINKKAIEIEAEVASQNEEIIDTLNTNKTKIDSIERKVDFESATLIEVKKLTEEISKSFFEIKVIFAGGIFATILQIIGLILTYFAAKK
jgi:hypothetical protein